MIPDWEDGATRCNLVLWPVVRKGREAGIGAGTLWPHPMGDFSSFTSSSLRAGVQGCDSQREGKERKRSSSALQVPGARQEGRGRGVVGGGRYCRKEAGLLRGGGQWRGRKRKSFPCSF